MHTQRFKGDLDALAPIRQFVSSVAREAGLEKKAVYDLCLAVDEIASNVITHGYEEAGLKGDLRIRAKVTDSCLFVYLEDYGAPYDPENFEVPTEEDLCVPLEDRPIGGLGILLARDGVDQLNYRKFGDRHVHEFIVRRNKHV